MGETIVHSCERACWKTERAFLDVVERVRPIVLDPCAAAGPDEWFALWNSNGVTSRMPWHCASDPDSVRIADRDGLALNWRRALDESIDGLVFMNPPYGGRKKVIDPWIEKAAREAARRVECIGLVPASTGSQWFGVIWRTAQALCFVEGRLQFEPPGVASTAPQLRLFDDGEDTKPIGDTGSATFWNAVPYWGDEPEKFEDVFADVGVVQRRWRSRRLYPHTWGPSAAAPDAADSQSDA